MHTLLLTLLLVSALIMVILILMQRSRGDGLSEAITGGAEQLFSKQKSRGIEVGLSRLTVFFAILFFVCAFLLGYYF
ncbi:preprotein translocase subunit SecG [Sporolactobacillus sp. THM7-4]|nr:preprotein translocase subunit SecG [Sporolactobacillus sp. THM7-4]